MEEIVIYRFNNRGEWDDQKQMLLCCSKALWLLTLLKKQKKKIAFYREVPDKEAQPSRVLRMRESGFIHGRARRKRITLFFEPIDFVEVGFYR